MPSTPRQAVHVTALCGSLREGSLTRRALAIALEGAVGFGAETSLIDLRDFDLPLCCENVDTHPEVLRLRETLRGAQGIIIGTPEYHGSFSGVLKNALDLTGFKEFEGKIVGLVSVSGGQMGGIDSLNSLRGVGRSLHAWVIPEQVIIPEAWRKFDDDGQLTHDDLRQRLMTVGRQVARFAVLHTSRETLDFLQAWESAPPNPGGG